MSIVVQCGVIYYLDTDSALTNVELPSSKKLGEMKDEYPGEWLNGTFIQPKVYLLEKDKPFAKEHLATCKDRKCPGCATFKIAMKGLPKRERTLSNLIHLTTCVWCKKKIGFDAALPCTSPERQKPNEPCEGGTVEFTRLEKVRTLATVEFSRPPQMIQVKKRIMAAYDKRLILSDGRTKPIRLSLPPKHVEEPEEEMQKAAE